jgi:hypothetical protein
MPPNKALDLTPLRVEQDRGHFESGNRLDRLAGLRVRRSSAPSRSAEPFGG